MDLRQSGLEDVVNQTDYKITVFKQYTVPGPISGTGGMIPGYDLFYSIQPSSAIKPSRQNLVASSFRSSTS